MFTKIVKEIFPNSLVIDAALQFPITEQGWKVMCPSLDECRFKEPDFYLILNLQDMLTTPNGEQFPNELEQIAAFYDGIAPMDRIIVSIWPKGIAMTWNECNSFKVVEFSSHQYETWESYKHAESVLRKEFSTKRYEDNFLCMNRIDKSHRKSVYDVVKRWPGNSSYQQRGIELKYPSWSYTDYHKHYDNVLNLLTLKENFNTTGFSIITESQYYTKYGIITEKVFNAIVAGHPFILIGHRNALEDVEELGFRTYSECFEQRYDDFSNEVRASAAIYDNEALMNDAMSEQEMIEFTLHCQETIDYNRDYFFEGFGPALIRHLRNQLLACWGGNILYSSDTGIEMASVVLTS